MNGNENPGCKGGRDPHRYFRVPVYLLALVCVATIVPGLVRGVRELAGISTEHPVFMTLIAVALIAAVVLSRREVVIPDHPAIRERRPLSPEEVESGEAEKILRAFDEANRYSWRQFTPFLIPLAVLVAAKLLGAI